MEKIALSSGALDARAIEDALSGPGMGGLVTFTGRVRDHDVDGGDAVIALYYEAYQTMALAQMRAIVEEAERRFAPARVAMAHRTGEVAAGEIAVVVCAAAPHRREAFDACAFAIDALKARVAIWKQERFAGGAQRWSANA